MSGFTDEQVDAAVKAWLEKASDYTRLNESIRTALEAAEAAAWKRIEVVPHQNMPVLFYSETREWNDSDGSVAVRSGEPFDANNPDRDERFDLGFFFNGDWHWNETGHLVWEWDYHEGDPSLPTHWRPLPAPPANEVTP
jgi:hypothetical protein